MAEHVRPDPPELRDLASDPHDIIHGLAGELCVAFRDKSECEMLKKIAPTGYDHYARHRPPWFGLKDFAHMLEGLRKLAGRSKHSRFLCGGWKRTLLGRFCNSAFWSYATCPAGAQRAVFQSCADAVCQSKA